MRLVLFNVVNGLSLGSLLFLLSSGLTVVFGLMRVLNLSHGALFLLGAYLGHTVQTLTGSFLLAAVAGAAAAGIVGLVIQGLFLRVLMGSTFNQVLLTLGLAFVLSNAIQLTWGALPRAIRPPELLLGSVSLAGLAVPIYRVFLIGVAFVAGIALWLVWVRSRAGAMIRACVDDREIAQANGIPVQWVFAMTFTVGAILAGLGGVLAGPILGVSIGLEFEVLLLAVVVVVVGGIGSLLGAFTGSMLVGIMDSMGRSYLPETSYFTLFVPVVLVLLFRPHGLLGKVRA